MERTPQEDPDKTLPPFNPDATAPHIQLPERRAAGSESAERPLESLVSEVETQFQRLADSAAVLNEHLSATGEAPEYGGMKLLHPRLNLDLSLSGVDENGVAVVVPPDEVLLFLDSLAKQESTR